MDFDVGESYAGLLSITDDPNADEKLFFWFWPSTNPAANKEIVLWLNGGVSWLSSLHLPSRWPYSISDQCLQPGCSSLMGMIQENGPFLWPAGAYEPEPNPWSWHHLSNVIYVEQPRGTGFSPLKGNATIRNEDELSKEFMGFWKNFIELFSMQGYKIYITGESYAGMYCPFIAANMLDAKDTSLYNVAGVLIYDPVVGDFNIQDSAVTLPFVNHHHGLFPYNDTFSAYLHKEHETCGFDKYIDKYMRFPPAGPQPTTNYSDECSNVWSRAYGSIFEINPCFDVYEVSTMCPMTWDVLGFPSDHNYTPAGSQVYLDREDVKKAIHAPTNVQWGECSNQSVFFNDTDDSDPSSVAALPRVIDATKNVIIGHGLLDMVLIANGTLLTIQNMTWGGKLGFEKAPVEPLLIPPNAVVAPDDGGFAALAGNGVLGTAHEERGLTYTTVTLSGHMVPGYAPSVAWRHLEKLLGRVDSLNSGAPFSINVTNPPTRGGSGASGHRARVFTEAGHRLRFDDSDERQMQSY